MNRIFDWTPPNRDDLLAVSTEVAKYGRATVVPTYLWYKFAPFLGHVGAIHHQLGFVPKGPWQLYVAFINSKHVDAHDDRWAIGFPHTHKFKGCTVVHYLSLPTSGGELVINPDDDMNEFVFTPELNKSVCIFDQEEHGVYRVRGGTPRITTMVVSYEDKPI